MIKLGLYDFIRDLTAGVISKKIEISKRSTPIKVEDVTINGTIYYRCIEKS